MRILLSNDDGVTSSGIRALALHLKAKHEVFISAPDAERSGASHSITYLTILRARKVELQGLEGIPSYAVNGTPADCVKLAIRNLVPMPDFVISGINAGANRGSDTFYSGTVAAAMEAAFSGVRAIAVSACAFPPRDYGASLAALDYGMELMEKEKGITLMNINAPDTDEASLRGMKITPLARFRYVNKFDEREDLYGVKYYWADPKRVSVGGNDADDDLRWTGEGYAAITPLLCDMSDCEMIKKLRDGQKENEDV